MRVKNFRYLSGFLFTLKLTERRDLFDTGRTPSGPKVQNQHLTTERGRRNLMALIRCNRKARRPATLLGGGVPQANKNNAKEENGQCDESCAEGVVDLHRT